MNFTNIIEVLNYISDHTDGEDFYNAYHTIAGCLDSLTEYILQYSDYAGYYSSNPKSNKKDCNYKFKTNRQLQKDLYTKGRKVNQYLFCNFVKTNDNGEEYYSFDYILGTEHHFEKKSDDNIWYDKICKSLTSEEKDILDYRMMGLTLEKCSDKTGLSIKQVRNRLDKCKKKISPFIKEISEQFVKNM